MEHVVFFPGADASPSFRRFASLEEAVQFVEHLRNAENVSEVSVHGLTPVPVAFRAYYKVEVPVGEAAALSELPLQMVEPTDSLEGVVDGFAEPVDPAELGLAEAPALAAVADDVDPVLVPAPAGEPEPASNGKRSLGFFAH